MASIPHSLLSLTWTIKVDTLYPHLSPAGIQVDKKYPLVFPCFRRGNYWEGPSQAAQ